MTDKPDHSHDGLEFGTCISLVGLFVVAIFSFGGGCANTARLDRIESHIKLCPLKTEEYLKEQGLTCDDIPDQGEAL